MKHNIRLAMLIDCYGGNFVGGGQTYLDNILRILEEDYQCDIKIFTQQKEGLFSRLLWNVWIIPLVIWQHIKNPFDIIHAQAFSAGISGKILSLILGVPLVYSVHGSHSMDMVEQGMEKKSWKYYFERFLLTKIKYSKQISVSANFIHYSNVNKRVAVIENGTSKKNVENKIKRSVNNKIKLLFVGRLEKIKGLEILFHSLALIPDNIQYELKIVGEGSLELSLKSLSQKLRLSSVIFVGKKTGSDLEKLYLDADMFILPSIAEGQPIVLLDAWSYKLPVLVTTAGHNPWMVENNKDGFLVKLGNVEAMTQGLLYALGHREELHEMGESGFRKVTERYTWEIAVQKLFKEYQKLL